MKNRSLQLQHLNNKMASFVLLKQVPIPPFGWIKAIRMSLGMTMQQLANKANISKQAVLDIEKREMKGGITIKSLKEIARALDMQLVYGFVPKDGSLEGLIEKKANQLAKEIVFRTSNTMHLEDQGISKKRIEKAIEEMTEKIKTEMPKILWD